LALVHRDRAAEGNLGLYDPVGLSLIGRRWERSTSLSPFPLDKFGSPHRRRVLLRLRLLLLVLNPHGKHERTGRDEKAAGWRASHVRRAQANGASAAGRVFNATLVV